MAVAAETRAQTIFNALDAPITIPAVDLSNAAYALPSKTGNPFYDEIGRIDITDLTEGSIGGNGAFEKLMASMKAHLRYEFDNGRITGDQYTKVYIEGMNLAMQTGLQLVMGKELAYWQAMLAREQGKKAEIEAVQAAVALEVTKAQLALARYQAEIAQAQFTLTKMQLASEDAKYQLTWEQIEVAHAQYGENKLNGDPMAGTIKRQRDLLTEQKNAFIRDSDAKIAKFWFDVWAVQRTTDEGVTVPSSLNNEQINEVMNRLRNRGDMNA